MNLRPGEQIAGYPAMQIRWLMRRMRPYRGVTAKFITDVLKIGDDQVEPVISQLIKLGYIQSVDLKDDRIWFTPTSLGVSLSLASAAKRITRKTAERTVTEFMNRVNVANAREDFLFWITSVVVYGSYLTDSERLGDVDFGIELTWREADEKKHHTLIWDRVHAARSGGRHFANITDEVSWCQEEILLLLKSRKRSISIHHLVELKELAREKPLRYRVLLGDRHAIATQLGPLATQV